MDALILGLDRALRTLFAPARSVRPFPGAALAEGEMVEAERRHAAALMRVNHVGEVCAQALYQGQALTCRDPALRGELQRASDEEVEHLAWTERRIAELGGRRSILNPVWYGGSLAFGVLAGKFGDRWNLGFLAETERQVEAHLDTHLDRLPPGDERSRAIVRVMKDDEARHADNARAAGAATLPAPIPTLMGFAAEVMRKVAYRV